jgi:Novel STAND NTPase 1
MNPHELRAIIERPAILPDVQVIFEDNLVGDLLFEAQGQIGALPLLEFTLDQLFRLREDHRLTRKAYQQIGGVKGALAKHAESAYGSLPSEQHRRLARALFLRLIDPGITEQDTTRRRAAFSELSLPDPLQTALLREVADAFVAARLLTTNESAGITTIEVSHEALIREWAHLAGWLRENREDILAQQAISADATEWVRRDRPEDRLYRGTQLIEAQFWAERNMPNTDEADFLKASASEHTRQEALAIEQKERETSLQRRVITNQRRLISALSVFSVVVVVVASLAGVFANRSVRDAQIANQQSQLARQQAQIALSRTLAFEADKALSQNKFDLALLLSNEATQLNESYETRNSLLNSLKQSSQLVTVLRSNTYHDSIQLITFGSTNSGLLVSSDGYRIFVWNTKTPAMPPFVLNMPKVSDFSNYVGGMALSANGQQLALSSPLGVWLQDTQTGLHLVQLDGTEGSLPSGIGPTPTPIAFSENGHHLLSARCEQYTDNLCTSTKISMWDMTTHQLLGQPHSIQANANTAVFNAQK